MNFNLKKTFSNILVFVFMFNFLMPVAQAAAPVQSVFLYEPGVSPTNIQIDFYPNEWSDVIDYWTVEYKKSTDTTWTSMLSANNGGSNWARITGLLPGTSYDIRVYATNSDGQGPYSDITTVSTPSYGPAAVDFFGSGRNDYGEDWTESNSDNTNTSFSNPSGVAIDKNHHRLFVADGGGDGDRNHRIMVFNLDSNNEPLDHIADAAIYSVDIDGDESLLRAPRNVLYDNDSDTLFIADSDNGRIVVVDGSEDLIVEGTEDDPWAIPVAQNILGAGDFDYPLGMTLDSVNGRLFVAEKDKTKGSVYGSVNVFDVRPAGSTAKTMCGVTTTGIEDTTPSCSLWASDALRPRDVAFDSVGQVLYAAYADQNRVLSFDARAEESENKTMCGVTTTGLPTSDTTAMTPSCVLGQTNMDDTDGDTTQSGLDVPRGLWFDQDNDRLFVADLGNNRVLQFNGLSSMTNGMDATAVFGQGAFTQDNSQTTQYELDSPNAVTIDPITKRLYVSDNQNNRIMVFALEDPPEPPATPPTFVDLPGTSSAINVTEGQTITTNPYTIKVKPTDTDGIKKVEFYIDNILICTDTTADSDGVYSCDWDTSKYHSDIKVLAYDTNDNVSTALTRSATVRLASTTTGKLPETGGNNNLGNILWLIGLLGVAYASRRLMLKKINI
ncbi:MAG: fibronectin type III domain-containing protein [bacterium]